MRVGVAGLGRMGSAIAARLMEVGHAVTVWNRSTDKVKPLAAAGAKAAASPAELSAQVEAIVTILTNRDAIAAVYEGHSGLLAGNVKGKLFIEMSTVQPETEVALAAIVFIVARVSEGDGWLYEGGLVAFSVLSVALITTARRPGPLRWALTRRPVVGLGLISSAFQLSLAQKKRSPARRAVNCLTRMAWNSGPTSEPGTWSSARPPSKGSIRSTVPYAFCSSWR